MDLMPFAYGRQLIEQGDHHPGSALTSAEDFRNFMYMRHLHSLAPPGEAVGLLAAQVRGLGQSEPRN